MSSENRTYDKDLFIKSITDAIKSCSEIRNDIRHYKMHLMKNLLKDYICIDKNGTVHTGERKTILLKDTLSQNHSITAGPKDMSIYHDSIKPEGTPLLIKDHFINQSFHADHYIYIDSQLNATYPEFLVRGGDILMIQKGEHTGSATVMPLNHAESLLGPECIRITLMHNSYDVFFIINLLHFFYYHNAPILKSKEGIEIDKLLTLPIPALGLDEQKEIALQMLKFSAYMVAQDVYCDQMNKLRELVNDD